MQKMAAPCVSTGSSYSSCRADSADVAAVAAMDQFPAGLRVLVVDDDLTCLKILEHMLLKCRYRVTTCSQAMTALSLLRERKGGFDVVISDVHMPDMDGFKLLELVGLEMDLPVIMMSADGRTSAVMRGIKHGACDYLIKPVRIEELKNIWQHVLRKKWNENRDHEHSGSFEDSDNRRRVTDEAEYASSGNEGGDGSWKAQKKKRDCKEEEDDGELENEDPSASKKPRVVWSVELHQQFVNAVNQLGIDKAVPKRILELMNVPGLTRENVASHLQKFRLYLKRISGVMQHQGALPNSFCNPIEASTKVGSLGRLDFQSFASSGQIPPQALTALHAELLGRPSSNIALPVLDQPLLLHASSQGPKILPVEREVAFGQPVFKCQSGVSKPFPQAENPIQDMPSTFPSWSSNQLDLTGSTNKPGDLSNSQNNNLFLQILQQSQHQHHEPSYSVVPESHNAINVQPSCLVLPSQSLNSLKAGSSSVPINSNSMVVSTQSSGGFFLVSNPMLAPSNSAISDGGGAFDYGILSSLPNNLPFGMGEVPLPSSALGSSVCTTNGAGWRLQNQSANVNIGNVDRLRDHLPSSCIQGTEVKSGLSVSQGQVRNLGFVGKGTCLSSRFAIDDIELPINDQNDPKINLFDDADQVKQEFVVDFPDGAKVGNTILSNFASGDFMGVLSKDSKAGCFLKS